MIPPFRIKFCRQIIPIKCEGPAKLYPNAIFYLWGELRRRNFSTPTIRMSLHEGFLFRAFAARSPRG